MILVSGIGSGVSVSWKKKIKTFLAEKIMEFKTVTKEEQAEIITEDYNKLSWGYFFPNSAKAALGARLIYDQEGLTAVNGRVAWHNDSMAIQSVLIHCKVFKKLFHFLTSNAISPNSAEIVYGEDGNYRILATPNASYGYVYFSAWEVRDAND